MVTLQEIEKTGGIKKALKTLKEYKEWIPEIKTKNKNGAEMLTKQRETINKTATNFYRNLYNLPETRTDNNNSIHCIANEESVPDILPAETRKAIMSQKNNKAPGEDMISNELLKGLADVIVQPLTELFNMIIKTETIPQQWTKSTIILIHKKGDKNKIDNYRPISLMANTYKIFSKIILDRLTKNLDEQQPKEQAGFRNDFSTVDHIHSLKQLIEKQNI